MEKSRFSQFLLPGEILVAGYRPVEALIKKCRVSKIWIRKGLQSKRMSTLKTKALSANIPFFILDKNSFDSIKPSGCYIDQGIMASARSLSVYPEGELNVILSSSSEINLLVLDGITDPYNLGACMRSAEAFGFNAVIQPKNRSASLNQSARKASCGATELIPLIEVTNLARCLRWLKENNFEVIGGHSNGQPINCFVPKSSNRAVVMGSEGFGLRRITLEVCDQLVWIPTIGSTESLNVSVATGIMLYTLQQNKPNRIEI